MSLISAMVLLSSLRSFARSDIAVLDECGGDQYGLVEGVLFHGFLLV